MSLNRGAVRVFTPLFLCAYVDFVALPTRRHSELGAALLQKDAMISKKEKSEALIPAVYNIMEMAVLLGISEWMVYQRARTGQIPGTLKIGNTYRFLKTVINEWLAIRESDDGSKAS